MGFLLAGVAALVAVTWWIQRVNARYEAKRANTGEGDRRVDEAWDSFGATDEAEAIAADVTALLEDVPVETLMEKASLVRLALMCVRGRVYEPLTSIAARARVRAGGCAESAALEGLACAYGGDPARGAALLADARAALAGCASCGGGVDGQVLLNEVMLALDAAAPESSPEPAAPLNVRVESNS